METIPFNRPHVGGRTLGYVREAFERRHLSGDGPFTRRCHAFLEQALGVPKALLTTSCTHALEMAALLLDLKPGDEVVVPSFTFVSTANAFALHGARPVFADVRPDTLNLDESRLEGLLTERTRAVVVVHYAGVACEMDAILALAQRHGLAVIEDNAHGLFGRYRGRNLGTLGRLATLSFHETKNIQCGEVLREKGTDRSRMFRGEIGRYTWVDVGSSYLPAELLAAVLCAQLDEADSIQRRRREVWEGYREGLAGWAEAGGVRLPVVPEGVEQAYHMFYLVMPTPEQREGLIRHLKRHGVHAVFHYLPLHLSPMGRRFGGRPGDCPVTEWVSERLVRLPFFADLTGADQRRVIDAVRSFPAAAAAPAAA